MHELDRFVKQSLHCRAYLRYCDDFLLFADDKPTLHRWRREIEAFLANLRLKLHAHKTTVYPVTNGIPFLGFRVYPTHRRLQRSNGVRFQRRLRKLMARYHAGAISLAEMNASVQGWAAHAAHGDTYHLRKSIFQQAIISPSHETVGATPP